MRELRHAVEHAVAVSTGRHILPAHLPSSLGGQVERTNACDTALQKALQAWVVSALPTAKNYDALLDHVESQMLDILLRRYGHKPSVMAQALDMNRATLLKKRRLLGLK